LVDFFKLNKWDTEKLQSNKAIMYEFLINSKCSKVEITIALARCNWFVLEVGKNVQLILLINLY